ncbi:MAG: hypothetical protein J0L62_05035 [Bacteroidetes bacterium]|nr:hypothetical protein [Bacteroidota bacterium]
MSQSAKLVYLFDGVPLGFSVELAHKLGEAGHKILVAVKTQDGKIESEFVRQIRKTGCDGFAISPSERSEKGILDMLDAGFGRYGRISHVLLFRQIKAENEEQLIGDFTEKTIPAVSNLVKTYKSYPDGRFNEIPFDLILHVPAQFTSSELFKKSVGKSTGLSNLFVSESVSKKNPFLSSDQDTDVVEISRLFNLITVL